MEHQWQKESLNPSDLKCATQVSPLWSDARFAAGRALFDFEFGLTDGAGGPRFYLPVDPEFPYASYAQIIVNMLDFGMNLQEAGDAARVNHQGSSSPTGTTMLAARQRSPAQP